MTADQIGMIMGAPLGFRPIVCLNSDIRLEKLYDGSFEIIS